MTLTGDSVFASRYPWPTTFGQGVRLCPKCGSVLVRAYSSVVMPHYPSIHQHAKVIAMTCEACFHWWTHKP